MRLLAVLVFVLLLAVPLAFGQKAAECKAIPFNDLRPLPQGWAVVETKEVIPYEDTRPSPDDRFYRCSRERVTTGLYVPLEMM